MNAVLRVGLGIVIVVVLAFVGMAGGWVLWGRGVWSGWGYGMGPGMMRGWNESTAPCTTSAGWGCVDNPGTYGEATASASALTIEDAREAVERYIDRLSYSGLEIDEVMEFERNFYAIVQETDTGIGAMELLVDKWTGAAGPEIGPNMMWNTKYGMHGRGGMMGRTSRTNTLASDEVLNIAQRWLDANRPGVMVEEHADPFYGYYTIHTLKDGEIEGMLSVHSSTGQVWYHTWHGTFVQMIVEEEH